MIRTRRFSLAGIHEVFAAPGATQSPGNTLFIQPGSWMTGYGPWQFATGLTCLMKIEPDGTGAGDYVIVGGNDPLEVCCAFAHLHQFGNYDGWPELGYNQNTPQFASAINYVYGLLKKRSVAMACGAATVVLRHLLSQPLANPGGPAHETRQVQLYTAELWNGYNDGHVAMEVKRNGQWMLYDPLLHRAWKDATGAYMTLGQFSAANAVGVEHVLAPLYPDNFPYYGAQQSGYHWEIAHRTHDLQHDIINRLYRGAIGIWQNGTCYFHVPAHAQHLTPQLLSAGGVILPQLEWLEMFY